MASRATPRNDGRPIRPPRVMPAIPDTFENVVKALVGPSQQVPVEKRGSGK